MLSECVNELVCFFYLWGIGGWSNGVKQGKEKERYVTMPYHM